MPARTPRARASPRAGSTTARSSSPSRAPPPRCGAGGQVGGEGHLALLGQQSLLVRGLEVEPYADPPPGLRRGAFRPRGPRRLVRAGSSTSGMVAAGARRSAAHRGEVRATVARRPRRATAVRAFAWRGVTAPPGGRRGRAAQPGETLLAEPLDAPRERGGDLGLVGVRGQELLLRVADEGHLHQDRRHGGPHEDSERGLLDPAPLAARHDRELLLDARGERRGLLEVLGLGHVPEDEGQVRARGGPADGSAAPSAGAIRRVSSSVAWYDRK